VLPHPGDPRIHEAHAKSALTYVDLAEAANGPIRRPVSFPYVWGEALEELQRVQPDASIINLETSISRGGRPWPKGINYRMNPENFSCLRAAGIDCCVLANNHLLDWDRAGLLETVATLDRAGLRHAGAGRDADAAAAPAVITYAGGRIFVTGFAAASSGVPTAWRAEAHRPGVNLLPDLSPRTAERLAARAVAARRPGDIAVASIHWGGNWGYEIPEEQRIFAHALLDCGFDIIHGHSSHHPKRIEIHRQKLILYGCGDFLNDYEGIAGYEAFRGDLVAMYLPRLAISTGRLLELRLVPFRIRQFRLNRASRQDAAWLRATLERESAGWGAPLTLNEDSSLSLRWP